MNRHLLFSYVVAASRRSWFILILFGVGCGGARHMTIPQDSQIAFGRGGSPTAGAATATQTGAQAYFLQVGDELDIKFYRAAELNEVVRIRPDGKISLQYVHDVQAAGLEPMALARQLSEKYASELVDPQVTVIVREFANQRVYVDGEVKSPKEVALLGPLTALQALSQAGGCLTSAEVTKVLLVRYNPETETREVRQLNLEKVDEDVLLEPLDLVYVPRRGISDVNLFIEQYILNNIPGAKNPSSFTRF